MTSGSVGRPPSRNWTEWVKWSWLVHVTVVPEATAIDAGSKRYEAGRSTVFVVTGEVAAVELPVEQAAATNATATTATTATRNEALAERRRMAGMTRPSRPSPN